MELYILKEDVHVFCVTVKSFPNGIADAFKTLEKMHPSICERPFYGIFHQDKSGVMIYKAAVEEAYKGEGKAYGCETHSIGRGKYITERITGYMNSINSIPEAFQKLSADMRIDKSIPCIEWYKNDKEVMCMIKLKTDKNLN